LKQQRKWDKSLPDREVVAVS